MILSAISVYPIKSLKGIALPESAVEPRGLRSDRRWMLVDAGGRFITQREFPKMALIETAITGDGLEVAFNGRKLSIPAEPEPGIINVGIWEGPVAAAVFADDVNGWFSDALGAELRLVSMPPSTKRLLPAEYAIRPGEDVVSFADGYPVLLIGQASLDDLNSRLSEPVPMNRFRPNFVVGGAEAFAEDSWRKIRIGETIFHLVKPCARCVITTVDQSNGEKTGKEPLATLSAYRNVDGKALFGQNLIAENPGGVVRVGDEVEVLEAA